MKRVTSYVYDQPVQGEVPPVTTPVKPHSAPLAAQKARSGPSWCVDQYTTGDNRILLEL
jgi:hypothetical protein